jgi:hypothetical protein
VILTFRKYLHPGDDPYSGDGNGVSEARGFEFPSTLPEEDVEMREDQVVDEPEAPASVPGSVSLQSEEGEAVAEVVEAEARVMTTGTTPFTQCREKRVVKSHCDRCAVELQSV